MAIKTSKVVTDILESLDKTFSINIKELGTGGGLGIENIELEGTTLKLTMNDGSIKQVDLASIDTKDAQSINGKAIDALPSETLFFAYNPTTQKFEFIQPPNCEDNALIYTTQTKIKTGLTESDVQDMITNRIAMYNWMIPNQPIKYICLDGAQVVPINKGLIEYVQTSNITLEGTTRINFDGDFLYIAYTENNLHFIKKIDFDFNEISVHQIVNENDEDISIDGINAITKGGKRFFCSQGVFDLQANGTYKRVSTKSFEDYGVFICNACGNEIVQNHYVYTLDEAGTWNEGKWLAGRYYMSMNYYKGGFLLSSGEHNSGTEINSVDKDYNMSKITNLDVGISGSGLSSDGKVAIVNSGRSSEYYLYIYIYDEEDKKYKKVAKIKSDNGTKYFKARAFAFIKNNYFISINQNMNLVKFKLNVGPSLLCMSTKTYNSINKFDIASLLNENETITALDRYKKEGITNYIIATSAKRLLKVDVQNNSIVELATLNDDIASIKYDKISDKVVVLFVKGDFVKYSFADGSTTNGSFSTISFDAATLQYQNDLAYLTTYTDSEIKLVDENGNVIWTKALNSQGGGSPDGGAIPMMPFLTDVMQKTIGRFLYAHISYDSNNDVSTITVEEKDGISSQTSLSGQYTLVKIANDNTLFVKDEANNVVKAFCIEDLNYISLINENTESVENNRSIISEYQKSQAFFERIYNQTTIETFELKG